MERLRDLPAPEALASRRTTPDHVADVLRESILTGLLEEGEELNQVALAEHFEVSRVPIREALRQLQAEGLIRQEAHRRAVVATLTTERIMELFDIRILLETYMLERALLATADDRIEELQSIVDEMDSAQDHHSWLELNRRFHDTLYEPSGATYTSELANQIARRTTRYLYVKSGGAGIKRVGEANDEHRAILEAVRRRDMHRASRLLEAHIEGTRGRVEEFLAERDAGG